MKYAYLKIALLLIATMYSKSIYAQSDLILTNLIISTSEIFSATNSITAGPNFHITETGMVTLGTPTVYLTDDIKIESGGEFIFVNNVVDEIKTSDSPLLPTVFKLEQNYPNPFNPVTHIKYAIPKQSEVVLSIYNIAGQLIEQFRTKSNPGTYIINWNASDQPSGMYFMHLKAGQFQATRKCLLIK